MGLLRALLYKIIELVPEIAPRICPSRWAMLKILGQDCVEQFPPWTWGEISNTFTFLDQFLGQKFNLAIFIDGLDEFDGDYTSLIELVKQFHSRPGVEVCVSSRPWSDFRDAFISCPKLRMESLTHHDMHMFVRGRFDTSIAFRELSSSLPEQAEDHLTGIVLKAEGVFFWVSVVTNAPLQGPAEGDNLTDLKLLLDSLPSHLSELYTNLWRRIKPSCMHGGAQPLLLFRAYIPPSAVGGNQSLPSDQRGGMPAEMLWLADGSPPIISPKLAVAPNNKKKVGWPHEGIVRSITQGHRRLHA
ncbi:hypothetical protein B0H63DRAFT_197900 [Podospora didyma]|uniref:Nephrocystin 3-like N-terminal domain-containing protein n=1 Tax=Podospora didyma TaxID=330526 RepID=A0AAE0TVM3_9PEZI|nr:hypothetical protein B0H63DRAFT_197900 [Podospora didyma]